MSTEPEPFDVAAPLGAPVTVIEASAGTGKTYALSGLAVRLLADGDARADELLVVTFTRAATAELRDRIRLRLDAVSAALARAPEKSDDELITYLRTDDPTRGIDVEARRRNLHTARSEFDALTVATIHSFARQVLGTFGVDAGVAPEAELVAGDRSEVTRACRDERTIRVMHHANDAEVLEQLKATDPKRIGEIAGALSGNPGLRLHPDGISDPPTTPELSVDLARAAVRRVRADRRRRSVRVYDDLILDLDRAVTNLVEHGPADRLERVRDRFRFALIDEFQDTDPIQWRVFSNLFAVRTPELRPRLVLVGDPKQAIYRFRGADLHAYAAAIGGADRTTSLTTNWRSDVVALAAVEKLFRGVSFGAGATFVEVGAKRGAESQQLHMGGTPLPGLSVRIAHDGTEASLPIARTKTPKADPYYQVDALRAAIREDLVQRVGELLDHGQIDNRPVTPSDIAILTSRRSEGIAIAERIRQAGIPVTLLGAESVLTSPGAADWRLLLTAVANPADTRDLKAAATSIFGGATDVNRLVEKDATPDGVGSDGDEAFSLDRFRRLVAGWADTLRHQGVATFVRTVFVESAVTTRVFDRPDGDRLLTDLEHVADLLREADLREPLGLLEAIAPDRAASDDAADAPDTRRIDSDRHTVKVMTMHKAKGLEFPIVCCPELFTDKSVTGSDPVRYHDDHGDAILDLQAKADPAMADGVDRARLESIEDRLRLAYVALTRAAHHTLVWWGRIGGSENGPLTRLLFGRDDTGAPDATLVGQKIDGSLFTGDRPVAATVLIEALTTTFDLPPGTEVIRVGTFDATPSGYRWSGTTGEGEATTDPATLDVAGLGRTLTHTTNRWSFTAITRTGAGHADTGSDDRAGEDESHDEAPPGDGTGPSPARSDRRSGLTGLTRGAEFGTLVHTILEQVDFASPTVEGDLDAIIDDLLAARPESLRWIDDTDPPGSAGGRAPARQLLRDGLVAMLDTPLGPIADHTPLRRVASVDRLNELDFDLRLPPGSDPVPAQRIGETLLAHLGDADPYRDWAASVATGRIAATLAGHLTGSIDLVLRVGPPGRQRFIVVDYKTNALHDRTRTVSDHYAPERLVPAMTGADYPLQALLYTVALHRYLRWRIADYSPERHLGGVAYLFVRGMIGAAVGDPDHPDGIARWDLPADAVTAVSDLLDGRHEGDPA